MTPEQIGIARRLVARPEWRWRARMHLYGGGTVIDGNVVLLVDGVLRTSMDEVSCYLDPGPASRLLPDLTDDATGGVLLGMLQATPGVMAAQANFTTYPRPGWTVDAFSDGSIPSPLAGSGPTLAEAAARALLACWEAADGR